MTATIQPPRFLPPVATCFPDPRAPLGTPSDSEVDSTTPIEPAIVGGYIGVCRRPAECYILRSHPAAGDKSAGSVGPRYAATFSVVRPRPRTTSAIHPRWRLPPLPLAPPGGPTGPILCLGGWCPRSHQGRFGQSGRSAGQVRQVSEVFSGHHPLRGTPLLTCGCTKATQGDCGGDSRRLWLCQTFGNLGVNVAVNPSGALCAHDLHRQALNQVS